MVNEPKHLLTYHWNICWWTGWLYVSRCIPHFASELSIPHWPAYLRSPDNGHVRGCRLLPCLDSHVYREHRCLTSAFAYREPRCHDMRCCSWIQCSPDLYRSRYQPSHDWCSYDMLDHYLEYILHSKWWTHERFQYCEQLQSDDDDKYVLWHCQWSLSNAVKRSFLIIIEQQVWKAT